MNKRRARPSQLLYVPPAFRNLKSIENKNSEIDYTTSICEVKTEMLNKIENSDADILQSNKQDTGNDKKVNCTNCENNSRNFIDKKLEDLDHVIEVYDFPESFKTHDIMQLYSDLHENPVYVKWCDDTHALLVFSTPAQARVALKYEKEIIKSRPLVDASPQSKKVANKIDLKPAMQRPVTNMQTARRLINGYLGTKVTISKEDMEKEKKALIDAKERKRIQKQNEKDAWDGHPRTNI